MSNVPVSPMSKAFFLLTVAGLLMAGGWAHGDTYDLRLDRIQLFGDCTRFEPNNLAFSPRPPSTNDFGVGYDTRAGGPAASGDLRLESMDYWLIVSMDLTVGYEDGNIIFGGYLSTQDFHQSGAWYDMHEWNQDERVFLTFLRHDPPGIETERAMIFAMSLSDACVAQLDWRYLVE